MKVYLKDGNIYWLDEPLDVKRRIQPVVKAGTLIITEG